MQIEAKDISGFLPEKIDIYKMQHGPVVSNTWKEEGFNEALDLISAKKLEVVISGYDLIKLIKGTKLTDKSRNFNRSWNLTNGQAQAIGQAIIHSANTDNGLVRIELVEEDL